MVKNALHYGLAGLVGATLLSSCRFTPPETIEGEKNLLWDSYPFKEVYDLTTSLATTLEPEEACRGFDRSRFGSEASAYDSCLAAYTQFQEQLPTFSFEDISANTSIQTFSLMRLGADPNYSYFTGTKYSVTFKEKGIGTDLEQGVYLTGIIQVLEEGCEDDIDHYYSSVVCYSYAYQEPEGGFLGCTMTMNNLFVHPAFSYCGMSDYIQVWSGVNGFTEEALNEDLTLLHYDYARALEELVLDVEEE